MRQTSLLKIIAVNFLPLLAFFFSSMHQVYANNYGSSIVRIKTTSNSYSYRTPWLPPQQYEKGGTGFVINDHLIVTNAHVVSDNVYIEVRRADEIHPYQAQVVLVDHDCDLALLKVEDKKFLTGLNPLPLANGIKIGDTVGVYGFPIGGDEVSLTKGVVSRIEMNEYAHSGKQLLLSQIDAAINPGNSGGPVLHDDKVVGVATQGYTFGQNIGYMIPLQVLRHFLDGYSKSQKYRGFPSLGISVQIMENPAIQKKYKMMENHSGVLINKVDYNLKKESSIKEGDVILSINDKSISNNGTVLIEDGLRVRANYLITKAYVGDSIRMKVLREGQEKELKLRLQDKDEILTLVSDIQYGVKPEFYTFGGFIFQPLSANYLHSFSMEKSPFPPPALLTYYYANGEFSEARTEVVIITKVLPDSSNQGYQYIRDATVASVNGVRIKNMQHLIKLIQKNKQEYLIIELEDKGVIVLDYLTAKNNNETIISRYNIPYASTYQQK